MSVWRVSLVAALLLLAGSIVYLGYSINKVVTTVTHTTEQLPIVLDKVSALEKKIDSRAWLEQVTHLQQEIPLILQQVKAVNTNIAEINKQIPLVLDQVSVVTAKTVPNVLSEVKQIREQTLPRVLVEVKQAQNETIPSILKETKAIRTQVVPPVLAESKEIRLMAPELIKEANQLVNNAERVGREASVGAVEGTVEGILSTPVNLIKKVADKVDPREAESQEQKQDND